MRQSSIVMTVQLVRHTARHWLCVFSIFFIITVPGLAQVVQTTRFEREQKGADELYTVISLKEEGLILLREKDNYSGNKKNWEIILLDTALQEKKYIEFPVDDRYPLIGYEVAPQHLFLLYRTGETNKNSMELIDFNIQEGIELARYSIKPELDFKITHFSKAGSNMVLGGYVANEPAILLYDMTTKNIKVVPGFFQKDNELVDLRVNQNQTFNTVLIDRSTRSERKLLFKTFDETGNLLLEDIVPIGEERSLQASISSTLEREDLIVLGTWGDRQAKQASGFFSMVVDPFGEQKIKYYHFGELAHFLDYLSPKRAERIKANTKEDLKTDGRPSFSSYVMPFRIEERPEGFLLLAEIYNPVTTTNPYYSTPYGNPYYGSPYSFSNPFWPGYYPGMRMYRPYSYNNVKNADEMKTYSTVLVAFDAGGNLLWDQSIKLDELKRPSLEQVSEFYFSKSNVVFLYKKESQLKVKNIALDTNTATESSEKLKLNDPADEVRDEREYEGGVKQWTGNTFIIWGYHTIRNITKEDRVRDVFYVNKVVVK